VFLLRRRKEEQKLFQLCFSFLLQFFLLSFLNFLNIMGGGNGQKSAKAREKAQAKAAKGGAGSMLSTFFSSSSLSLSLCF
jgi:hypothetical protein